MGYQQRSYKKFVATAATATLVASAIVPVASAANFSDVSEDNEFKPFIDSLSEQGIINGYDSDNTFRPNNNLTRGQVAIMLGRWLEKNGETVPTDWDTNPRFSDVSPTNEELAKYAALVSDAEVFTGVGGKLNASQNISRQHMAVVLDRVAEQVAGASLVELAEEVEDKTVADLNEANADYRDVIQALVNLGISTVSNFRPTDEVTRAHFAKFLYTTIEIIEEVPTAPEAPTAEELQAEVASIVGTLPAVDAITADNATTAKTTAATVTTELTAVETAITEGEYTEAELAALNKAIADAKVAAEAVVTKADEVIEAGKVLAVESVTANNLKQVVVTFNKEVDPTTGETVGNYTFATGSNVTVADAEVDGRTVTLTVNGATQQQTANLTIEGVKSVDNTVAAKTTQAVRFVDVVAPTVSAIDAIGPRTVKVTFSEPLQTAPIFSLNEGTIAIVSTSFTAGSNEATLTLGTAPAAGNYKLNVSGGQDYAGFRVDEVVRDFAFAVDTVAPVLAVKSATPTQIVLTSNEDITGVADANVEFFHTYNGVEAYKATKAIDGREITLTFANPLPEGAFRLFLNYANDNGTQIADLWGNKVAEQTIAGSVVADTVAPTVTKVEAVNNTAFQVTFSEAVSGATTAANYEIKDAAGNVVSINSAITNVSGNTYTIPVAALNGGSYTLTVKNIQDTSINKNKMADYSTTVAINDVVAPQITDLNTATEPKDVQLLSNKKVKIVFSEAMNKASIENKLNYLFDGVALDSEVTATAVDGNKAVVLDFTEVATDEAQATPAGKTLQVLRVTDAAGNPIAAASTPVIVPGTVTAPLFDRAEVTGQNTIKLYFDELITSAQAADFLVSNESGANFVAAGSIANEVVDGKSVITLTTSQDQDLPTTAAGVVVKTAEEVSAKNSFGTAVSLPNTTAGDKYGPTATVATAVENDNDTFVNAFTVEFDEDLYVASVQESDFTIEGYEITGVSVTGDTVTLSVKEKTVNDLAATPKVTLVGTVEDDERNARTGQDALTAVSVEGAVEADEAAVDEAQEDLEVSYAANDSATSVTQNVTLPTTLNGTTISWASSAADVVSATGVVARPVAGEEDAAVTLTATITKGDATETKTFALTVKALQPTTPPEVVEQP